MMRIIYKFTNLGPETCEIEPKVGNRTCPDLPRPVLLSKFIILGLQKGDDMSLQCCQTEHQEETQTMRMLKTRWKTYIFLDFWVYFRIFGIILRFLALFLGFLVL